MSNLSQFRASPLVSTTAKYFLAAPNAAAGTPTFRAIVASDVPTLNQNTTGSSGSCTGNSASATTAAACTGNAATATTAGTLTGFAAGAVQEIGKYLDFHAAANGFNYDIRLYASAGAASAGGTFIVDAAGGMSCTGDITASSDERLKTNWLSYSPDFVTLLAQVKSGTYDRIDTKYRQVGVSAQSLQTLMPEAVLTDSEGMLSVAYGNAALAACVELAKEIVLLRAEINKLKGN